MARDTAAVQKLGSDLSLASITFTPIVVANGIEVTGCTPNTLLYFKNGAVGAKTATIVSSKAALYEDISVSVAAGEYGIYGFLNPDRFYQTGTNTIHVDSSDETDWSIAAIDADYIL